jgi:hypothetical protein
MRLAERDFLSFPPIPILSLAFLTTLTTLLVAEDTFFHTSTRRLLNGFLSVAERYLALFCVFTVEALSLERLDKRGPDVSSPSRARMRGWRARTVVVPAKVSEALTAVFKLPSCPMDDMFSCDASELCLTSV